jgi:hypothetical protein
MGDHRFSFKATFEMHGIKDEINLDWLNWGGFDTGIDHRITDWIESVRDRAMAKYEEGVAAFWAEQNKAETEKAERAELARLKAKYDQPSPKTASTKP